MSEHQSDTSRRADIRRRLSAIHLPLTVEEVCYYETADEAQVGDWWTGDRTQKLHTHTDFVLTDGAGVRVADFPVNHAPGDTETPEHDIVETRALAEFFQHAANDLAYLLGYGEN